MKTRGFTLIELLVVVLIISLIYAVVPPVFNRGESARLQQSARELMTGLRWARAQAVGSRRAVALWVNTQDKTFSVETKDKIFTLPEGSEVRVTTVESEIKGQRAGIRFFPDGSSTGGKIELTANDDVYLLAVDWLTGGVELERNSGE